MQLITSVIKITTFHTDYLKLLKEKAEFIAGILLDYRPNLYKIEYLEYQCIRKLKTFQ